MAALAVSAALSTPSARAEEREVFVDAPPGRLAGTLTLPDGPSRVPAVLILAGSGPTDRNGNTLALGLRNDSLALIARGLAERGIASLRVDKRGVGGSAGALAGSEASLRFGTYVDDAALWLDRLRGEPRAGRIFVLGHSEGALVATLVAGKRPVDGLVLVAGAGRPALDVIEAQAAAAGAPAELRAEIARIGGELLAGRTVETVPQALVSVFRPSAQPYVASWFAIDPVAALAATKPPVLVIQGTTDLQVGVDDARRLVAARPGVDLVLVDGMNHVLKTAPVDRRDNLATYTRADLPVADALWPPLVAFLNR